ncbi:MAG TPA: double zinc ribbon domain-containing protein [Thermoanaerobaculia bacterium]|nr:double zinc ribbon domain-containing protein [Thermoanaerobaculia bacterium]
MTALQQIGRAAADFLLPSVCLACESAPVAELFRGGVCSGCWTSLPRCAGRLCALCDVPLPGAEADVCGRCRIEPPPFRALRAAAPYRGSARAILLAFKFRGADYLAARLAEIAVGRIAGERNEACGADVVTAVPATRRARRRRGYQPAELFGEAVASRLGIGFDARIVRKIRETSRQSGLSLRERRKNVARAFRATCGGSSRVLLVDDVATSGWTARESAAAIVAAGAAEVDVWCFARASRDDFDSTP